MKRIFLTTLLLTSSFALTASAQTGPPPPPLHPNNNKIIDQVNRSASIQQGKPGASQPLLSSSPKRLLEGRIVEVVAAEKMLVVESEESGKRFNIPLDEKTKLKADKGTELAGNKHLTIADFKPGQFVNVFYRFEPVMFAGLGPTVLEVRLRRKEIGAPSPGATRTPDAAKHPGVMPKP